MGPDRRRWRLEVAVLVATLFGARAAFAQDLSPGQLARVHEQLEGIASCSRCHSRGDAVDEARCLGCHTALRSRVAARRGYHAKVGGRACEACHVEHRGKRASLVRWPGGGQSRFEHLRLAGFELRGKHAEVGCRGCHRAANVAGRLGGASAARTFLGLGTACARCHRDPHQPSLGGECQRCHDESAWARARAAFDHSRARFPLRGAHARVACAGCHPNAQGRGATTEQRASFRTVAFSRCTDCHRDPHAGRMGAAGCESCHTEVAWAPARYDLGSHAPRSFPLAGAHRSAPCASCHGPHLASEVRTPCSACHREAHQPSLGAACQSCHGTTAWTSPRTRLAAPAFHDRTSYPLRGAHASVPCERCHDPRVPAAHRFRPIPHDRCATCHADVHRGELATRADGGACESCHDLDGFRPSRFEVSDHRATRFELDGAHRAVACESCHPRPPDASPPVMSGFRREDRSCEACHRDPHGGQFAGRPSSTMGSGCTGCHGVGSWAPSRFGAAEHARLASFTLDGEHAAPCIRCHSSPGSGRPVRFVGTRRDCGACHRDVHAGQFGRTACTTCHAGARFSPATAFDHGRSRFQLRGAHLGAACADCHRVVEVPSSGRAVVYRLGAPSCEGCHGSPHGDLGANPSSRSAALARATAHCGSCHREEGWTSLAATARGFDHGLTEAPLVLAHERVACVSCHVMGRSVPPMTDCGGCHQNRHASRPARECVACHTPRSWLPDETLDAHRRTRFPLSGAHAVQSCTSCHDRVTEGDYRGASAACESCHLDTVRERRPHPEHESEAFLTGCHRCHSPVAWVPATFDHQRFWPLSGAHRQVACSSCHAAGRYDETPVDCAGCHEGDQEEARVDHSQFDDPRECDRCHGTTAWTPAEFPDHDRFFRLRGAHRQDCARCHTDPDTFTTYSCTNGCHRNVDREHDGRSYAADPTHCVRSGCHGPGGGGDD